MLGPRFKWTSEVLLCNDRMTDLNLSFKQIRFFMIQRIITLWVIVIVSLTSYSCNDTTFIGSDLLDDQAIGLDFTDTITLKTSTISGVPINTNDISAETYIVGDLEDPIFGTSTSDLYFSILALDLTNPWNFTNDDLDSIVLTIAVDTFGVYGKNPDKYTLELFEGVETLPSDTILSDQTFTILPDPISVFNKTIDISDSINVYVPDIDTTMNFEYHIRMILNDAFSNKLFNELKSIDDNEELTSFLPSLYLSATSEDASLLGLSVGLTERIGDFNQVLVYTTDRETNQRKQYDFRFEINRASNFVNDYSGSLVENSIDNPDADDEFFYVQGMAGVRGVVDISAVDNFRKDVLINKVELELTIAEDAAFMTDCFLPIQSFQMYYDSEDGFMQITDFRNALGFGGGLFGGIIEEEVLTTGETVKRVKMNITNHVKEFLDDTTIGGEIIISSFSEAQTPNRTVFYGAGHSRFAPKLNISFTKP